jgi:hypothetical protein
MVCAYEKGVWPPAREEKTISTINKSTDARKWLRSLVFVLGVIPGPFIVDMATII